MQQTIIILLFLPLSGISQNFRQTTVKHTNDFTITGDSIAREWKVANWISMEKRRGVSEYETKAKLLYSDSGFYALFYCEDKKITATLREDFADLYNEDVVEIFLWTDESSPIYFEYELSPLDYELPIIVPNFGGDYFGWKPWHYEESRLTKHGTKIIRDTSTNEVKGWIAEFFIPYALLKPLRNVPPKKGMKWRINFYRIDYDTDSSSWVWQPIKKDFHDYERFGVITFD
jgi:hypothetical protein